MNKQRTFKISIIRPGKPPYNTEGKALIIPSYDGYIGILCDRQPLLSLMSTGLVCIKSISGQNTYFAISGGFAEVQNNEVTLLCDFIVTTNDLPEKLDSSNNDKKLYKKFFTKEVSTMTEEEKREYLIQMLDAKISKNLAQE